MGVGFMGHILPVRPRVFHRYYYGRIRVDLRRWLSEFSTQRPQRSLRINILSFSLSALSGLCVKTARAVLPLAPGDPDDGDEHSHADCALQGHDHEDPFQPGTPPEGVSDHRDEKQADGLGSKLALK